MIFSHRSVNRNGEIFAIIDVARSINHLLNGHLIHNRNRGMRNNTIIILFNQR